jgi:hypothetical protein
MPIQSTTDCGSETTLIYGLASALRYLCSFLNVNVLTFIYYLFRECFSPELTEAGLPAAHVFLKSIYNITVERGWLRLRLSWGDNVKIFWEAGAGIYNASISKQ